MSGYPDNNPKTAIGARKVPLHLVPPSSKHFLALALEDGARKYGAYNWRDARISASVYKAAAERHLDAFWDGEDCAQDSGIPHIAHAMACMALMLDAQTLGMLNDDRPKRGASPQLQSEYQRAKSAPVDSAPTHAQVDRMAVCLARSLECEDSDNAMFVDGIPACGAVLESD